MEELSKVKEMNKKQGSKKGGSIMNIFHTSIHPSAVNLVTLSNFLFKEKRQKMMKDKS
jgi:hypothetical protein